MSRAGASFSTYSHDVNHGGGKEMRGAGTIVAALVTSLALTCVELGPMRAEASADEVFVSGGIQMLNKNDTALSKNYENVPVSMDVIGLPKPDLAIEADVSWSKKPNMLSYLVSVLK